MRERGLSVKKQTNCSCNKHIELTSKESAECEKKTESCEFTIFRTSFFFILTKDCDEISDVVQFHLRIFSQFRIAQRSFTFSAAAALGRPLPNVCRACMFYTWPHYILSVQVNFHGKWWCTVYKCTHSKVINNKVFICHWNKTEQNRKYHNESNKAHSHMLNAGVE